jgi:hypothetical protein
MRLGSFPMGNPGRKLNCFTKFQTGGCVGQTPGARGIILLKRRRQIPQGGKALPAILKQKLSAIGACVGGATLVTELRDLLAAAGFVRIEITPKESSRAYIAQWTDDATAGEFVVSALITAYKPAAV